MQKLTLFPYYGGKSFLLKHILNLIPYENITCYIEPYFGAGNVFFNKKPHKVEIINDIDLYIYNLLKTLQDETLSQKFLHKIQYTTYHEQIFYDANNLLQTPLNKNSIPNLEYAYAFYIQINMCFRSTIKHQFEYSPIRNDAKEFYSRTLKLNQIIQRLKNAIILNKDALEIIQQNNYPDTLFFIDPPYLKSTRESFNIYTHETNYLHHTKLIQIIQNHNAKFIITTYDNPLYDQLLKHNFTKIHIPTIKHSSAKQQKEHILETIYTNIPHLQPQLI
jgi:DNA adenine methylase